MSEKHLRIGILGLGRAGRIHLESWQLVPNADVIAVADPSEEARVYARNAGCRTYKSIEAMLDRETLDAVTIVAPPAYHAELAIAAMKRGLHVLCEKPLAMTTWDAFRMLQAANHHHRILLLATKFRHVPGLRAARDLIRTGRLGEIVSYEISFCSHVDMSKRWNCHPEIAGGGVIMDNGCHAIDIAAFLFGPVTQVHATALKRLQNLTVEDSATIEIRTESGIVGRADVSWSINTGRNGYVTIYGADGAVEVGWQSCRVRFGADGWHDIGGGYDKIDCHRRMFSAFTDVIRGGGLARALWIDPSECLRCVAGVEAAYRSLRSAAWEWVDVKGLTEQGRGVEVGS